LVKSLNSAVSSINSSSGGKRGGRARNSTRRRNRGQNQNRPRGNGADLPFAPNSIAYQSMPTPKIMSDKPTRPGAQVRYIGCDYIGSINTITTAALDNVYTIFPDNTTCFPRLSAMGSVFGKYIFNKLSFHVIGKAASTQSGTMTSVPVYEGYATGANPLTVLQARNRESQVTSKFWENHVMTYDCKKQPVTWFEQAGGQDTAVAGYFHFITEQTAAVIAAADLFVCYDIEFCESKAASDAD
jgi:hypothetical protein